jgi:hypothetical protein
MTRLISNNFKQWQSECEDRFRTLKSNEGELNRIFIEMYGLRDELTPEVEDKDIDRSPCIFGLRNLQPYLVHRRLHVRTVIA